MDPAILYSRAGAQGQSLEGELVTLRVTCAALLIVPGFVILFYSIVYRDFLKNSLYFIIHPSFS